MHKPSKTSTNLKTLGLLWRFTRPYKLFFWLGTVGAALAVIVQDIIPPIIIASAFNRLQDQVDAGQVLHLEEFWPHIIAYAGFMATGVVLWRVQVWLVWQFEIKATRDIAVYIFDHLQHMGSTFHANRFGGALVSQTNKFLSAYEKVMDEFTWSITTGVVSFITAIVVLVVIAPFYALIFTVISAVYFYIMYQRTKRTMKYDRALASSESERTAKLADAITNVSAVNAFASEVHERQLLEKHADHTVRAYFTLLKRVMVNDSLSHAMTSSISLIAFASGVLAITVFHSPAGVLFLAVNYTMQLTRRLWESNRVMRNLNRSFGDATDMTNILQLQPEIKDVPHAILLQSTRGDIRIENVNFCYPEQPDTLLFKGLGLHIKPGEKIGLVGHSGGGKTTLSKLLLRFMDIQGGRILIDGQDIAQVTQASLRQHISYVPQEPLMFHRSIMDNIRYGQLDASNEVVVAVAKMANAHEFIEKLPQGYNTLVGERGVKLSGGQRQRVAIARAMLKNAPILVLDEATSALDSESEVLIQDALWKLMEGRTAIVIAHRLSTIQKMDRIIVLDSGKIVEEGSHKDLLKKNGTYAKLWAHQSGGFIE